MLVNIHKSKQHSDMIALFHVNQRHLNCIKNMHVSYFQISDKYRENALQFLIKTPDDLKPYVEAINSIADKSVSANNPYVAFYGIDILNELQCDFVVENHESKMSFVFNTARKKIDSYMDDLPDNFENGQIKLLIKKSDKKRANYFNKDFSKIAQAIAPKLGGPK